MAKDINLNAPDWCDMVFEDKNKTYGAYVMRQTSGRRHVTAMLVVVAFVVFVIFLPSLIATVKKLTQRHEAMVDRTILADLPDLEDQVKEENIERATEAPPPPPLRSTVKFTAPVITDEPIEEGDELKSQDELSATKSTVSIADVKGTDEESGKDIADLEDHKVIVQQEAIYAAEIMPIFPGGDEELLRFIKDHLVYPPRAQEMGLEGRVHIRFVVNSNGEVSDVTVLRGFDQACDKEAVRVIKLLPKWIPGRQNGRAVPVYYQVPIVFKLAR